MYSVKSIPCTVPKGRVWFRNPRGKGYRAKGRVLFRNPRAKGSALRRKRRGVRRTQPPAHTLVCGTSFTNGDTTFTTAGHYSHSIPFVYGLVRRGIQKFSPERGAPGAGQYTPCTPLSAVSLGAGLVHSVRAPWVPYTRCFDKRPTDASPQRDYHFTMFVHSAPRL